MSKYKNAQCIPPIVGERMIMRNGEITGVFKEYKSSDDFTRTDGLRVWRDTGVYRGKNENHTNDIVARYIDPTALTENRIAYGLLDPDTRAAMEAWEHGWLHLSSDYSFWFKNDKPAWHYSSVYRAKPGPEPVNEVHMAQEPLTDDELRSVREILKERGNV